jgi:hypothetical protein
MNVVAVIIVAIVILGLLAVIVGCVVWIIWGVAHHINDQKRDRAQHEQWLLDQERQREREQLESERDRESISREYKELVERFTKLFSDGSSQWDELTRTSNALNGTSKSTPFRDGVELYTARILKAFSVANGSTPNGLGRMFHILTITGREKDARGGIPGNFVQMLDLTIKQWCDLGGC